MGRKSTLKEPPKPGNQGGEARIKRNAGRRMVAANKMILQGMQLRPGGDPFNFKDYDDIDKVQFDGESWVNEITK